MHLYSRSGPAVAIVKADNEFWFYHCVFYSLIFLNRCTLVGGWNIPSLVSMESSKFWKVWMNYVWPCVSYERLWQTTPHNILFWLGFFPHANNSKINSEFGAWWLVQVCTLTKWIAAAIGNPVYSSYEILYRLMNNQVCDWVWQPTKLSWSQGKCIQWGKLLPHPPAHAFIWWNDDNIVATVIEKLIGLVRHRISACPFANNC